VLQTVLTTEKGRVIDLANVYRLRDSSIMVICHAPRDRILRWMQKFIIMEDVTLTDETSAYSLYSFFGPLIERVLAVIGGKTLQPHNIGKVTEIKTEGIELIIGAVEPVCTIGVNALVRACDAKGLWKLIFEPGTEIDLKVCSLDSLDIHRVERGFPAYGKELTEEVNPLEAGLERFVSFTKGCYIGQEVIARLDTYDKLKRKLMGLVLTEKASVMPGASVTSNGETIGRITSVVDSVLVGGKIALAFIRSAWATHDATVEVGSESGPVTAHLIHLPFEARSYEPEL
jgi:folate-binding protein YgfZ